MSEFDLENKEDSDFTDKYRYTFFRDGICLEVFSDILKTCHFGCTLDPENKVQVSEYNIGVVLLAKCGVFSNDTLLEVIQKLSSIIPKT